MDDLSEDAAARKWSCNKGTIRKDFHMPKDLFTWARIDFPLSDDERRRGKRRNWQRRVRLKRSRRMMKRKCKVLMMKVRSFTQPKTFLLLLVKLFASFIGCR